MEEVITKGEGIMTLFPLLEQLKLEQLSKLGHFFLTEHTLQIPLLKKVKIFDCPEMKTFVQEGISMNLESVNNDDEEKVVDLNKAMFTSKVFCPSLEELYINGANSISALCSHELPTPYFSKLVNLAVRSYGKLRNLMPPSVARGALTLRTLKIDGCQSMEKVISEEEQQGEGIMTLFPLLEQLELELRPKLGHFFLMEHALQIPFLKEVTIYHCPEMKTFVQQGISVSLESDEEVKVMFNSKVFCPNLEELRISGANNINDLCSYQLPAPYFSKVVALKVDNCSKLRNLMSQSVARGLLNLRRLESEDCHSMEEVITEEEQQGEGIMTLFPLLEELKLQTLPKLGHFFLTEHALKFPFL